MLLAGCAGLTAPSRSPPRTSSAIARAQATHEYSSGPPPRQHAAVIGASRATGAAAAATSGTGVPADAVTVVRAFALAYINWSASTLSVNLHALAAASIGQARSAMQVAAA